MPAIYSLFSDKPYSSWVADNKKQSWVPPIPEPDAGFWQWDEKNKSWKEQMFIDAPADNPFGVVGYPRSGNHFLRYSIELLYDLPKKFNEEHTTLPLKESHLSFVPVRNPLDCISSWSLFRVNPYNKIEKMTEETVNDDIKYYLRFFNECLLFSKKICFLDFNKFTVNINYTISKASSYIGAPLNSNVSLDDVKESIKKTEVKPKLFLPEGTNKEIESAKIILRNNSMYKECVDLYNFIIKEYE